MIDPQDVTTLMLSLISFGSALIGFILGYLIKDYFADKKMSEFEDRISALRG
jgi:hypothetical protein